MTAPPEEMPAENNVRWIQGDGGPAVVLQATAALQWQGASDFANSLMGGGTAETDYDVICRGDEDITVIERYGRDMLTLADSEWAACFAPSDVGEVVVVQGFGSDSELNELVNRLTSAHPTVSLRFRMHDTSLRLLVGADTGDGELYGFSEIEVSSGDKVCEVYYSDEGQVVVLRPAEPVTSAREEL